MEGKEYQDPDYPVVIKQEESQSPTKVEARIEKARNILNREIEAEIYAREVELASIDEKMWSARRALHSLRCSLLQRYYGTSIGVDCRDAQSLPQMSSMLRHKQTRLHPSQRRLTNTDIVSNEDLFLTLQSPSGSNAVNSATNEDAGTSLSRCNLNKNSENSTNESLRKECKPAKIPRHIEPESTRKVVTLDQTSRSRQKRKYRIIIGNTSKYSPRASLSERCSHAWLLYVRTPHPRPSAVLSAVTVRLHESYAPDHVCRIMSPPFQVSRRGWGEFPAKVQLHFALPELNPPATVEHVIRLDKRCSGLQTLGAETIVDVWLYSNQEMLKYAIKDEVNNSDILTSDKSDKEQQNDEWNNLFSTNSTELDIDEMIIKPVKSIDNTDSMTETIEETVIKEKPIEETVIKEEPIDYEFEDAGGIDNNDTFKDYLNIFNKDFNAPVSKSIENKVIDNIKEKSVIINKEIKNIYSHIPNDHCYIPKKDLPNVVMVENLIAKLDNSKKHKFDLGKVVSEMSCIRSAVNFLLGKIPLISENASVYKSMFPFMVASKECYWKKSDIKRKCAEWSRAKIVNNILKKHFRDKSSVWRTKQILYFSRFHGYSPTLSQHKDNNGMSTWNEHEIQWELHKNFKQLFPTSADVHSGTVFDRRRFETVSVRETISFGEPLNLAETMVLQCDSDDEIDVTSVDKEKKEIIKSPVSNTLSILPIENEEEKLRCYFIEKACLDIGIELRNEDIGNGYAHSAVHRVMLSAARSFISEVIRSSLAERRAFEETPSVWAVSSDGDIGVQHVFRALRRSDRLNVLTLESLCAPPADYTERL